MKHLIILVLALCAIACVSGWRLRSTPNANATSVFEPPITSGVKSKRSAVFQFTYDSSNPAPEDVKDCFQRAGDILASSINLNIDVKVLVSWEVLSDKSTPGIILGAAAPGRWCDGGNFWYAPALLDQIQNRDTLCQSGRGGTTYDIIATFNSDISPNTWNTDPNKVTPSPDGEVDLTTVALHELIHGLGFQGLISDNNGIDLSPDQRGTPFDDHLFTGANRDVKVNTLSQNGLASAVTSGNLWFLMSSGGSTGAPSAVQLYAPHKWEQGSSVYHLNESTVTNPADQLMLPDFQAGQVLRSPGPIALGVLQSIGYTIGGSSISPSSTPSVPTETTQEPILSSASSVTLAIALLIVIVLQLIA